MPETIDIDSLHGAEHTRVYREHDGDPGFHWRGANVLLLTTTGRKSGEERTTPLIFREDGDRWVIVASKGGTPEHPSWYVNMLDDPEAEIQVKAERIPVRMSTAEGDERERLWKLMNEQWPDYDSYQEKTDRKIPVVVLERR
jgi:deazaflavin-dependent oxidoreductase (nitroreductase family)